MNKIKIGENEVGIIGLCEIFNEIRTLEIEEDALKQVHLREELLKRVKLSNWVPKDKEEDYKEALFEAYKSFCKKLE